MSYSIYRNPETKKLELESRQRKCLHLYFYYQHEIYGFLHIRLQTWFPFSIQICMNGREWLAKQLKKEKISYQKQDNCFLKIGNIERSQESEVGSQ